MDNNNNNSNDNDNDRKEKSFHKLVWMYVCTYITSEGYFACLLIMTAGANK